MNKIIITILIITSVKFTKGQNNWSLEGNNFKFHSTVPLGKGYVMFKIIDTIQNYIPYVYLDSTLYKLGDSFWLNLLNSMKVQSISDSMFNCSLLKGEIDISGVSEKGKYLLIKQNLDFDRIISCHDIKSLFIVDQLNFGNWQSEYELLNRIEYNCDTLEISKYGFDSINCLDINKKRFIDVIEKQNVPDGIFILFEIVNRKNNLITYFEVKNQLLDGFGFENLTKTRFTDLKYKYNAITLFEDGKLLMNSTILDGKLEYFHFYNNLHYLKYRIR